MSQTHQDENPAQPQAEPTASYNALHSRISRRELASESTPVKKKYGPDFGYTSVATNFEDARKQLGKEMDDRWLGAMPVDAFLDKYLPATEAPLPDIPDNPFEDVPMDGAESARYGPFIAAISGWMPHLHAVNTKEDTVNKLKLKTDISVYNRIENLDPPDRTDFSKMELWMEFKTKNEGPAFQDPRNATEEERLSVIESGSFTPDTMDGNKARGQLAHYAGALHSLQFRHSSFSIAIQGDHARFLRWEPGATVVTAAFDYRANPRLMAEFLWRFDHLSPSARGHDESVQLASLAPEIDMRVREKLGIKDENAPLYKYAVPGLTGTGHAYGPKPASQNRSLASRCTRGLPVVWIPTEASHNHYKEPWLEERVVYMKDTWRFLSDLADVQVKPEHEIYAILHEHKAPNIPELVAGGDVEGGRTKAEELVDAPWLCVKPRISPYQHYLLLLGIVGRPLVKFECTKQLVSGVFDALQAHSCALNRAKILHRDVSTGNIILTDDGKGMLIDWELAKMMDEVGSRRPDRTGTWQFMSANLLQHPGKLHTLTDDLESFLHVMGWTMLRYVPAADSYVSMLYCKDMAIFEEHYRAQGHSEHGGQDKARAFRAGDYPSSTFQPKCKTPLFDLLTELSSPFKSVYARRPPTTEERQSVPVRPDDSNKKLQRLWFHIDEYDEDMRRLESHAWFIDTMQSALGGNWPTDDKASENPRIAFPDGTRRQVQIWTNQRQHTHNLLDNSRTLTRSSKRAASPTPEPYSAKRHRGTPTGSETQN